jgi:hypothetical protein
VATLTQLYTRVILDLANDSMGSGGELEQAKIDAVTDAIELYEDQQFWFNRASGSGNTTASTATITMPSGVRYPHTVAYSGEALQKVPLGEIQHRTETGQPTHWAENEGTIQLWPIPDDTYSISVYGLASVGIPASGGATNIWTTEAYKLILAATKKILLRDTLRDVEGAQLANAAEEEALSKLRRETRRRGVSALRSDLASPGAGFNINRGF